MLAVIRVSDIEPERASGPKNTLDFGAYGYQVVDEVAVVIFEADARVGILAATRAARKESSEMTKEPQSARASDLIWNKAPLQEFAAKLKVEVLRLS